MSDRYSNRTVCVSNNKKKKRLKRMNNDKSSYKISF